LPPQLAAPSVISSHRRDVSYWLLALGIECPLFVDIRGIADIDDHVRKPQS